LTLKRPKIDPEMKDDFGFLTDVNLLEERKSFFGNHDFFSPHTSPRDVRERALSEDNESTEIE
jgi:hypothetical protein